MARDYPIGPLARAVLSRACTSGRTIEPAWNEPMPEKFRVMLTHFPVARRTPTGGAVLKVEAGPFVSDCLARGSFVGRDSIFDRAPRLEPRGTPVKVAAWMAEQLGDLPRRGIVLEPSAGFGRLCRAVRDVHPEVSIHAVEIQPGLTNRLLGYCTEVHRADFLKWVPSDLDLRYNAVIMNPPRSRMHGEFTHIRRAYDYLAPGGTLITRLPMGMHASKLLQVPRFLTWVRHVDGEELTFDRIVEGVTTPYLRFLRIKKGVK